MTEEEIAVERRELCRIHALRLDNIDKHLVKIDQSLNGNGRPETGLVWIAKKNDATLGWISKIAAAVFIIVFANIAIKVIPKVFHFISTVM